MNDNYENPSAVSVRETAVLLIAADSALGDDMNAEDALAFARRMVNGVDTAEEWKDGRHCGDCTKQAHTCLRCVLERAEATAREMWG